MSKAEGIAIKPWDIRLNGTEDVGPHVWDFGRQEIMHATHRYFLSQRGVDLLIAARQCRRTGGAAGGWRGILYR